MTNLEYAKQCLLKLQNPRALAEAYRDYYAAAYERATDIAGVITDPEDDTYDDYLIAYTPQSEMFTEPLLLSVGDIRRAFGSAPMTQQDLLIAVDYVSGKQFLLSYSSVAETIGSAVDNNYIYYSAFQAALDEDKGATNFFQSIMLFAQGKSDEIAAALAGIHRAMIDTAQDMSSRVSAILDATGISSFFNKENKAVLDAETGTGSYTGASPFAAALVGVINGFKRPITGFVQLNVAIVKLTAKMIVSIGKTAWGLVKKLFGAGKKWVTETFVDPVDVQLDSGDKYLACTCPFVCSSFDYGLGSPSIYRTTSFLADVLIEDANEGDEIVYSTSIFGSVVTVGLADVAKRLLTFKVYRSPVNVDKLRDVLANIPYSVNFSQICTNLTRPGYIGGSTPHYITADTFDGLFSQLAKNDFHLEKEASERAIAAGLLCAGLLETSLSVAFDTMYQMQQRYMEQDFPAFNAVCDRELGPGVVINLLNPDGEYDYDRYKQWYMESVSMNPTTTYYADNPVKVIGTMAVTALIISVHLAYSWSVGLEDGKFIAPLFATNYAKADANNVRHAFGMLTRYSYIPLNPLTIALSLNSAEITNRSMLKLATFHFTRYIAIPGSDYDAACTVRHCLSEGYSSMRDDYRNRYMVLCGSRDGLLVPTTPNDAWGESEGANDYNYVSAYLDSIVLSVLFNQRKITEGTLGWQDGSVVGGYHHGEASDADFNWHVKTDNENEENATRALFGAVFAVAAIAIVAVIGVKAIKGLKTRRLLSSTVSALDRRIGDAYLSGDQETVKDLLSQRREANAKLRVANLLYGNISGGAKRAAELLSSSNNQASDSAAVMSSDLQEVLSRIG